MGADPVAAWRGVLLARHAVVQAIEADLAAAGRVPLAVYDVLLVLNSAPERCLRMQDLGTQVVLSRSRVSRLVDELEADGLVERRPDPSDRRATLAHLTSLGRRALRHAAPVYLAGIDTHFTSLLSHCEQDTIARGLQQVLDHHDRKLS